MVLTQMKRVPWRWVFYVALLSAGVQFANNNANIPLTLTVKKFIDKPWLLVMITSINTIFSTVIAPYASWKTDRIWTRFGRRKPFMIAGWSLMVVGLVMAPLAPNIWVLMLAIIIWQVSYDFGYMAVATPLFYEVVPTQQRGRGQVVRRFIQIPLNLTFNYVLIRQYDNHYLWDLKTSAVGIPIPHFAGWKLSWTWWTTGWAGLPTLSFTGAHVVFFSGAAVLVMMLIILILFLKEQRPANPVPAEKFALGTFFFSLFGNRQWRMIYLLLVAVNFMTAGLAALSVLLITDQFHYDTRALGLMNTLAIILEVSIILPLAAFIVDRLDRFKIFQWGLWLSTLHPICYWLFVKLIAPDQIPSISAIIFFTMLNAVVDSTAVIALEPLIFDLVPRNMMGTVNSGFLLVARVLSIGITYGVGFWVSIHAWLFRLPVNSQGKQSYDYMSGYLYVFALGVIGCFIAWYFGRELRAGRIIMYGKLEDEAPAETDIKGPPSKPGEPEAETVAPS